MKKDLKEPKRVDLTKEEADALIDRVKSNQLTVSDRELLAGIVQFMLWLQHCLREARLSITRLRSLFGFSTEKKRN